MAIKPGYKQTEIGVIPEDWKVVPLGQLIKKGRLGGNYANQDIDTDLPLMKMGNIARGYIDLSKVQFIVSEVAPDPEHRLVYGDVLFNTRNTLDLVGKVAIWRDELPVAYYNSNLMRLEFDSEQICLNDYANYFLNTKNAVSRLRGLATGTTSVAAIYTRDLLKLDLLVPPKAEQIAIATTLSDVDALIESLDKLIEKKCNLKQAAMQQLLTGKKRLPGFHNNWNTIRLGNHVVFLKNGVNSRAELTTDDRVKYLHYGDIHGSTGTFMFPHILPSLPTEKAKSLSRLCDGDLIFADASEDLEGVGKSVEITNSKDFEIVSGQHTIAVRFDKEVLADGFKAYLQFCPTFYCQLKRLASGIKVYATNRSHISGIEMPLPCIEEQTAIAGVFKDMDAEIEALKKRRDKTILLKQGMMQELLTGKTRLIKSEVSHAH
ncbi:MAG: restriction endonuclease subunit S [Desulfamplus sp.]|nr:restriction endonuclease subunit S [Desulfamplus sp.]